MKFSILDCILDIAIYMCNDPILVCFCKYCNGLCYYFTWLSVNLVELKLQTPSPQSQYPAETSFISLSLVRYFEFTLFIYNSTIAVYLLRAYEQNIEFCLCSSLCLFFFSDLPIPSCFDVLRPCPSGSSTEVFSVLSELWVFLQGWI